MTDINEGFISNIKEVFKVSKKISDPFQSYLKYLKKIKVGDDRKTINKPLNNLVNVINSSKLPKVMKERLVFNMYIDVYNTLFEAGAFNDKKIQDLYNWPDKTIHAILQKQLH